MQAKQVGQAGDGCNSKIQTKIKKGRSTAYKVNPLIKHVEIRHRELISLLRPVS